MCNIWLKRGENIEKLSDQTILDLDGSTSHIFQNKNYNCFNETTGAYLRSTKTQDGCGTGQRGIGMSGIEEAFKLIYSECDPSFDNCYNDLYFIGCKYDIENLVNWKENNSYNNMNIYIHINSKSSIFFKYKIYKILNNSTISNNIILNEIRLNEDTNNKLKYKII